MPRFFCQSPLATGQLFPLPAGAARHVQVLRLQPGRGITLFDGAGGEYRAVIDRMGRSEVVVRIGAHDAVERETARPIHLAIGMPANERMDWLVEKATELGAASIQPLSAERSVLKLTGERAAKKQAHWQAIAVAASEQCGRNRVPVLHAPLEFAPWCAAIGLAAPAVRLMLSLDAQARPLAAMAASGAQAPVTCSTIGAQCKPKRQARVLIQFPVQPCKTQALSTSTQVFCPLALQQ